MRLIDQSAIDQNNVYIDVIKHEVELIVKELDGNPVVHEVEITYTDGPPEVFVVVSIHESQPIKYSERLSAVLRDRIGCESYISFSGG